MLLLYFCIRKFINAVIPWDTSNSASDYLRRCVKYLIPNEYSTYLTNAASMQVSYLCCCVTIAFKIGSSFGHSRQYEDKALKKTDFRMFNFLPKEPSAKARQKNVFSLQTNFTLRQAARITHKACVA